MPREIISEKDLEKKGRIAVERRDGKCLKLLSPYFTGFPDRTILLPGGRVGFVEFKTTGKKLQPRQVAVKQLLERMGFAWFLVDDYDSLQIFLNWVDNPQSK